MVKVSIIVPVYNTGKYLKECLDSLVNQTFTDTEIICINDGSTDDSLEILEQYNEKYSNVSIHSQENSGLSISRNNGMKYSNGEYIYFMDSDDYLELTAIEELHDIASKNDLDFVIFKLINFSDETKEKYTGEYYEMPFLRKWDGKVFNLHDIGKKAVHMAASTPGKFFKRDFIKDMEFPQNLIYEDNVFFAEAMMKADRVSFYDKHLYNRRIRENSITTQKADLKSADTIKIMNRIMELAKEYGIYEEYKYALWDKKIKTSCLRFSKVGDEYKKEFYQLLREDYSNLEEEYVENKIYKQISEKSKYYYETALNTEEYDIFELNMKLFDAKDENKRLRKKNRKLKKDLKYYSKGNKLMLSSTSWKMTKPMRGIGKLFK